MLDVDDLPVGATLRVRWQGNEASRNITFGLDNVWLRTAAASDANLDGLFDSSDPVRVFTVGEYEDALDGNSSWSAGDWDNDGDFNTSDLVWAFQVGSYEQAPAAASLVPEPSGGALLTSALVALAGWLRRSRRGLCSARVSDCVRRRSPFCVRRGPCSARSARVSDPAAVFGAGL